MRKKDVKFYFGFALVIALSAAMESIVGYRAIGIIFLLFIFFIAITGSRLMVFISAISGALIWNFLFIPPRYTFSIHSSEDVFMYAAFVVVALISGYLTRRVSEAQRLKDSEALHQTLLNSISHEIRTPLTTILASISALEDEEMIKNVSYVKSITRGLQESSARLNHVIENLLDMSRLNSGVMSLKLEWHHVDDLIGVVIQRYGHHLTDHKLTISIPGHTPLIKMDFRLMEHAFGNFLVNASMYSPKGSEIRVIVNVSDKKLSLKVEDDGTGIPNESLNKIFDKFYRIPGSRTGGVGLGLSIVKNIVNLHNGEIVVRNLSPKGTSFSIELPIENQPTVPTEVMT